MSPKKKTTKKKVIKNIGDLKQDQKNRRKHNPRNLGMIEKALGEVGAARSIVIDENNNILAGNGTVEAAALAGIENVKVIEADGETIIAVRRTGLTKDQKRKLALYDNRSAELAEWDLEQLLSDLDDGLDLGDLFYENELDELLDGLRDEEPLEDPGAQIDKAEELRKKWGVKSGQMWQLGEHRIICGDCTDEAVVERLMGGEKEDCVITDPPYCSGGFQETGKLAGGVGTRGNEMITRDTLSTRGYQKLMQNWMVLTKASVIYIFTDWRMWISLFDIVEGKGFGVRQMIVWNKGSPGMGRGWRSQHELIMCGLRIKSPFDPKKAQGNVIDAQRTGNINHATEKPVELIEVIIKVMDLANIYYDPFLGSGTTLIACENLNRKCRGIEIEPKYIAVTLERWSQMTGQKPDLIDG